MGGRHWSPIAGLDSRDLLNYYFNAVGFLSLVAINIFKSPGSLVALGLGPSAF
jgi:hypothetical protein